MQTSEQRRPAIVAASHPDQRRFSETRYGMLSGQPIEGSPVVDVYRNEADNTARLCIELLAFAQVCAHLTPEAMRRLASDLLDAADDIEQNPAAALSYQTEQVEITVIADPDPVLMDAAPANAAPMLADKQFDEYHGWVPA